MAKRINEMNPITVSFRALDIAESKAAALRIDLAKAIIEHRDPDAEDIGKEVERLATYAKGIVAADGYTAVSDPKNLWSATRNYLLAEMMRDETVTVETKQDGETVKVEVPVADVIAKGTKAINKAASQLREKAGISDGRKGNKRTPKAGGKQVATPEQVAEAKAKASEGETVSRFIQRQVAQLSTGRDLVAALVKYHKQVASIAEGMGYTFRLEAKQAEAKAEPKAEAKPKATRTRKPKAEATQAEATQ